MFKYFTTRDTRIRNCWLVTRWLYLCTGVVLLLFGGKNAGSYGIADLFWNGLGFLLFYLYAYRKPGTKLLFFSLLVSPLIYAVAFYQHGALVIRLGFLGWIILIALGLVGAWDYWLQWKLRQLNKRIRISYFIQKDQQYSLGAAALDECRSEKELNVVYHQLQIEWPSYCGDLVEHLVNERRQVLKGS